MTDWILRHVGWFIIGLVIVAAGLVVVTINVIQREQKVERVIGPAVKTVGPCRTFGPDNQECRRQSRKIIRSCLTHADCLALIDRLIRRAQRQGLQPDRPADDGDRGGGDPSGSPQNQGQGLGGGPGAPPDLPDIDLPPPNPPSQHPPKPPPLEEITDEVTEAVCESWDELMPPQLPDPVAPIVCP